MFGSKKQEVAFDREWYIVIAATIDGLYKEVAKYEAHGYNINPASLSLTSLKWYQIIVSKQL